MPLRVRYKGTDLYPEGIVEYIPGDGYELMEDNTVAILMLRDGEMDNIGAISADRWDSIIVVEPGDVPQTPESPRPKDEGSPGAEG
jgi:hypothetical protein